MAGLLDFTNTDEGMQGLGLLSAAAPSMAPMNLAGRIAQAGQSYQGMKTDLMKREMLGQQMQMEQIKTLMAQKSLGMQLDAYYGDGSGGVGAGMSMGGSMGSLMGSPQALQGGTQSASGSVPSMPGTPAVGASGGSGQPFDINRIQKFALAGVPGAKELLDIYKYQHDPQAFDAGKTYVDRMTGETKTIPILAPGMRMGADGQVSAIPGFSATNAAIEGGKSGAVEAAKTDASIITVPDGMGGTRQMLGSQFKGQMPQMGGAAPAASAWLGPEIKGSFSGDPEQIRNTLLRIPNPQQRAEALRGLQNQMNGTNPDFSAQASPGATKPQAAPSQLGQLGYTPPAAVLEAEKARSVGSENAGQKYQTDLHSKVEQEFQLINRNKQIEPLLAKFSTGGFSPDERLHLANAINNSGMVPDSVKAAIGKFVTGGDTTAGKVIENQLASAGIMTMLQTLDKEGAPNRAIFEQVRKAQEGLSSGNTTLKDVFALQKQLYDTHYDEQQALTSAVKDKSYNPATWAGDYSKVRNDGLSKPATPLPSFDNPIDLPKNPSAKNLIKGQAYKTPKGIGSWNGMQFDSKD